jgi:hypothetical protein
MLIDIRGCYGTLIRGASTRKLVETAQTLMYVCSGYRTCVSVCVCGGEVMRLISRLQLVPKLMCGVIHSLPSDSIMCCISKHRTIWLLAAPRDSFSPTSKIILKKKGTSVNC